MQKQKNGHTGLLPNVTVIPFFPLEDVWIMVFELSLIRFAFTRRGIFCGMDFAVGTVFGFIRPRSFLLRGYG